MDDETKLAANKQRIRPLANYARQQPDCPNWYREAMAIPYEEMCVDVLGAKIEVLAWGDPSNPGLLLAHGMRGHARWWGPVAPLLSRKYRVVS